MKFNNYMIISGGGSKPSLGAGLRTFDKMEVRRNG